MIRSMTGYGSAELLTPARRFTVEIRSVNHRFSEILVRLPRDLGALEDRVRALVQSRVLRGRVDVTIMREERAARPKTVRSDTDLARAYAQAGEYAQRLRQRVAELLREVPVDEARLATEIAIFAERVDVSEEVTRLRSHLVQFREDVTHATGAVGRRLEFVLQEMGREANTIGSKASDLEITRAVIGVKGELESLREQVQNVE